MVDETNQRTRLEVWYCRGCNAVHLTAGKVRLSLNTEEFEAFTHAVANIYCGSLAGAGPLIGKSETESMEISRTLLASREIH